MVLDSHILLAQCAPCKPVAFLINGGDVQDL